MFCDANSVPKAHMQLLLPISSCDEHMSCVHCSSRIGNNTTTRVVMRRGMAPLSHCSAPAQKYCWHVRRRRKRSLWSGKLRQLGSCLPGAPVAASEASQRMLNVFKCSLAMQIYSSALRTTGAMLCFRLALSVGTIGIL